jgi:hypothetical protein
MGLGCQSKDAGKAIRVGSVRGGAMLGAPGTPVSLERENARLRAELAAHVALLAVMRLGAPTFSPAPVRRVVFPPHVQLQWSSISPFRQCTECNREIDRFAEGIVVGPLLQTPLMVSPRDGKEDTGAGEPLDEGKDEQVPPRRRSAAKEEAAAALSNAMPATVAAKLADALAAKDQLLDITAADAAAHARRANEYESRIVELETQLSRSVQVLVPSLLAPSFAEAMISKNQQLRVGIDSGFTRMIAELLRGDMG